jgi:hypothetical protein
MSTIGYRATALGIAGALAIGLTTVSTAGPLPTSIAAMKQAAPDHTTEVRWGWRGYGGWGGYGPGVAFGLAAGALAGAAIASPYYYGGPYYSRPVYAAPYGYAPYRYGPPVYRGYYGAPYGYYGGYGYGRCFTDEGYGRYKPCSAP